MLPQCADRARCRPPEGAQRLACIHLCHHFNQSTRHHKQQLAWQSKPRRAAAHLSALSALRALVLVSILMSRLRRLPRLKSLEVMNSEVSLPESDSSGSSSGLRGEGHESSAPSTS